MLEPTVVMSTSYVPLSVASVDSILKSIVVADSVAVMKVGREEPSASVIVLVIVK